MKCINVQCQKEIGEMMFCPFCGTRQVKPKVFCAYCGAEMDEDAVFCDNCGRKSFLVQQKEEAELEEQRRLAQEAEQRRQEEEQRKRQEKEKGFLEKLAADWTLLDDPDLAFRLAEGGVQSLEVKMYDPSSGQTDIIIPSVVQILGVSYNVDELAEGAFSGCTALRSIVLPRGLEVIPDRAFKNCSSLSSIELPESVVKIGSEAFAGSGLTHITIPDAVYEIGYEAFSGCRNLTSVEFIGDLVRVQNTTFDHTPFVKTLEYRSLVNSKTIVNVMPDYPDLFRLEQENLYGSRDYPYLLFVFSPKSNTFTVMKRKGYDLPTVLTIPRRVKIGNYGYPLVNVIGFESSRTLEKLVIPAPGEKINICKKAFAGCDALESIDINSREITLYGGAFENCTKLRDVELKGAEQPHLSVSAFSGCSALPMMKRLKLVKYHDVRVDIAAFKLELPSFLKR